MVSEYYIIVNFTSIEFTSLNFFSIGFLLDKQVRLGSDHTRYCVRKLDNDKNVIEWLAFWLSITLWEPH